MAEYKNGVNYRGNMSVETNDRNPEVHTGRAVFVDDELYSTNPEYRAKVDKCYEEGFHYVNANESGSDDNLVAIGFYNEHASLSVQISVDDGSTFDLEAQTGTVRFFPRNTVISTPDGIFNGTDAYSTSVVEPGSTSFTVNLPEVVLAAHHEIS